MDGSSIDKVFFSILDYIHTPFWVCTKINKRGGSKRSLKGMPPKVNFESIGPHAAPEHRLEIF